MFADRSNGISIDFFLVRLVQVKKLTCVACSQDSMSLLGYVLCKWLGLMDAKPKPRVGRRLEEDVKRRISNMRATS